MAVNLARFSAEIFDLAQRVKSATELREGFLRSVRDELGCDGALFRPGAHWQGSETLYLDEGPRFTDVYVRDAHHYRHELTQWCALSKGAQAFIDDDVYPTTLQRRMSFYADVMRPEGIRSVLACPVVFREQTIGLAFFFRRGRVARFDPEMARSVSRLAGVIALAECAVRAAEELRAGSAMRVASARAVETSTRDGDELALPRFRAAFDDLGPRQQQVALLIARGLQSKEIAAVLATSPNTVRCQTQQVFERLDTHGRARLAYLVHRAGLLALVSEPAAEKMVDPSRKPSLRGIP